MKHKSIAQFSLSSQEGPAHRTWHTLIPMVWSAAKGNVARASRAVAEHQDSTTVLAHHHAFARACSSEFGSSVFCPRQNLLLF